MSRRQFDVVGTGTQLRIVLEIQRLCDDSIEPGGLHNIVRLEDFDARMIVPSCPTIVCHGDPLVRQRVYEELCELEVPIAHAAVHPAAVLSSSSDVGAGSIINALVYLGQCAELGEGVVVHSGSIVEHDCVLCDYATIAPGVTICGAVRVGACAAVYAGATIGPNVTIGDKARVYAGAVVLDDVPAGVAVRGIPARCDPS